MWDYVSGLINPDASGRYITVKSFIIPFLNLALGLGSAISAIGGIFAGVKIAMSRGDPKAFAQAKQALIYSLLGFGLALCSFALKDFILEAIYASIPDEPDF